MPAAVAFLGSPRESTVMAAMPVSLFLLIHAWAICMMTSCFSLTLTGGAIALAVTTGVFNGEALKDAAEDKGNVVVMDGLSDVNAVLRACGLA